MLLNSHSLIRSSRLICHSLSVALPAISHIFRTCATYRQTNWPTTHTSTVDVTTVLQGTQQLPAEDVADTTDHDAQQQNMELLR